MMLPTCKTDFAVLLCAVADAKGVLRFPITTPDTDTPGLDLVVAPLVPINELLMKAAAAVLGEGVGRHLEINQEYADEIAVTGGPNVTLYLARLAPAAGFVATAEWPTMPELLRALQGRKRLPYLRAWQVLAGGLTLDTKAVETDKLPVFDA